MNYGMHTPLIDPIEQQCLRLLAEFSFSPPRIPIVSAVATRRVEAVSAETIWFAMRRPVEFSQTIERLLAEGDTVFLDLGPSGTLATFVKYILPSASLSRQASTLNRFGNDVEAMQSFKSKTAGL